jgi:hypothetical protein
VALIPSAFLTRKWVELNSYQILSARPTAQ